MLSLVSFPDALPTFFSRVGGASGQKTILSIVQYYTLPMGDIKYMHACSYVFVCASYTSVGIGSRALRPLLGIIDPLHVKYMPKNVAAYSGFDVLW